MTTTTRMSGAKKYLSFCNDLGVPLAVEVGAHRLGAECRNRRL
jgi:hypothetical protein